MGLSRLPDVAVTTRRPASSLTLEMAERYRWRPRGRWPVRRRRLRARSPCGLRRQRGRYPEAGAGVSFDLKPKAGMVVRLNYAKGKGDNSGAYLSVGQAF